MRWTAEQESALADVARWLRERTSPFFYLAGFAGTGKTTLARHFAEGVDGPVLYGAYTGKAASVMRAAGCHGAKTVHQLMYRPLESGVSSRLVELRGSLAAAVDEGDEVAITSIRREMAREAEWARQPSFELNEDSELHDADLVVIDECSMVGEQMGRDLLSFGVPVLVLGDPAQLPPVRSAGFFTKDQPDIMLTQVHRQAEESGILRLATAVREGRGLPYQDLGDARVIPKEELDSESVPEFDQVIVGRRKTRFKSNRRMREILGYAAHPYPQAGEKLICLRNSHERGLLNGEMMECRHPAHLIDDYRIQAIVRKDGDGPEQVVDAWRAPFDGTEIVDHSREVDELDWGYVITCHKAQGSAWKNVLVFDESFVFRNNARRWLYTAISRASEQVTVVQL